jgi:hypothetical protein
MRLDPVSIKDCESQPIVDVFHKHNDVGSPEIGTIEKRVDGVERGVAAHSSVHDVGPNATVPETSFHDSWKSVRLVDFVALSCGATKEEYTRRGL